MKRLKKIIKKILSNIIGRSEAEISKENIEGNIVSFDVFDTLILRNCDNPTSVFEIVQEIVNSDLNLYGLKGRIEDFKKIRCEAEKQARLRSNGEITLDEIYECVSIPGVGEEYIQKIKITELEVEYDVCQVNHAMKKIYDSCIRNGKKVFLISDMYMTADNIKHILDKCGIVGYYGLYVSSEYKTSKRDGELFSVVAQREKICTDRWIHIGDDLLADYVKPKKRGIIAYLYKQGENRRKLIYRNARYFSQKKNEIKNDIINRFIINNYSDYCKDYEIIGVEVLGPMLIGFSEWLQQKCKEEQIDSLFFLSREGYVLKEAYDEMFPNNKTAYLRVSRLALCRGVAIYTKNFKELYELFFCLMKLVNTVKDFVQILGFTEQEIQALSAMDIDLNLPIDTYLNEKNSDLYSCIMQIHRNYFHKQNMYLRKYFDEMNLKGKVAIVDIGWVGTMQSIINKFFEDVKSVGFYLGVSDFRDNEDINELVRQGYWFSGCSSREYLKWKCSIGLIETLFLSSEGTLLDYNESNGEIGFNLSINENDDILANKLELLRDFAINFVKKYKEQFSAPFMFELPIEISFGGYDSMAVYPKLEQCEFWKDINMLDGVKKFSLLPKHNLVYYIFHAKRLYVDFSESSCKLLWLKYLLKVPLPYLGMLDFLISKMKLKTKYGKRSKS